MNNKDFLDELYNDFTSAEPSDRLSPNVVENSLKGVKRSHKKAVISTCVTLGVVCVTLVGLLCSPLFKNTPIEQHKSTDKATYSELYTTINRIKKENTPTLLERLSGIFGAKEEYFDYAEDSVAEAPGTSENSGTTTGSYSQTNVQVNGIDEGDVTKCDGKYIYSLNDSGVVITDSNNGNPIVISTIENDFDNSVIYVSENRLALIGTVYTTSQRRVASVDEIASSFISGNYATKILVYDTTDKKSPKLISDLTQSGTTLSSRKIGDTLYIVTQYDIYDYDTIKENDPKTYCPVYSNGETVNCVDENDILINDDVDFIEYNTVSSLDLQNPDDFGCVVSVLGGSNELYASANNIYCAYSNYVDNCTQINRFSLDGLNITADNSLTVEGIILDQFSMDEYNGYFRIVTESNEVIDAGYDMMSIREDTVSSLYVYDSNLELVGKTEDVAPNEHIKSVRFDGDIAYFVTFRSVDPLFTVDLSDPTSPTILSELKIPGFSEYLHVFSDNLLLGFGREADEYSGGQEGLKLSMFDISDKTNVTLITSTVFTDSLVYSPAEYDHKAIFVDTQKSIIGIPYVTYYDDYSESFRYAVFYYNTSTNEFELKNDFKTDPAHDSYYSYDYYCRAMYIGDYFYLVTPYSIKAYNYSDFKMLSSTSF